MTPEFLITKRLYDGEFGLAGSANQGFAEAQAVRADYLGSISYKSGEAFEAVARQAKTPEKGLLFAALVGQLTEQKPQAEAHPNNTFFMVLNGLAGVHVQERIIKDPVSAFATIAEYPDEFAASSIVALAASRFMRMLERDLPDGTARMQARAANQSFAHMKF